MHCVTFDCWEAWLNSTLFNNYGEQLRGYYLVLIPASGRLQVPLSLLPAMSILLGQIVGERETRWLKELRSDHGDKASFDFQVYTESDIL
jgi:hypothetical protein